LPNLSQPEGERIPVGLFDVLPAQMPAQGANEEPITSKTKS
jgi:hypothetical protein